MDAEKPRHRTLITSDVRQQIALVNQKAREEWEKKQAEEEKLRKLNDVRITFAFPAYGLTRTVYNYEHGINIRSRKQCSTFDELIFYLFDVGS